MVRRIEKPGAGTLDLLLLHLQARTLIVTGIATEYCVLFTAVDAYIRDYGLVVPADCVASADAAAHRRALRHMKDVLKADVRPSRALDLSRVRAPAAPSRVTWLSPRMAC